MTKTIQLTKDATGFSGTITDLPVGSYTVTVRGLVGGEVDYFGQTSGVSVQAGTQTRASINFQSFVPTLSLPAALTWSFRPVVTLGSVGNATSYILEVDRLSTFPSPTKTTVTSPANASFPVSDTGTYYVRARAANSDVTGGGRASAAQSIRVTTDLRSSGTSLASAWNLGYGGSGTITLDSLNIYPASDDDWFVLSRCNGDSVSITARAVRLSPPSPLNTRLQLYTKATGRLLADNDDGDSTDARIAGRLSSDDTLVLRVMGANNTVGHYQLVIAVAAGPNNQTTGCKVQPLAVLSLSAGAYHTCAVRSSALDCWGYNGWGTLGNGTTLTTSSPTKVSSTVSFSSAAAGALHTCALASTGAAYCWGYNGQGQLGNGSSGAAASSLTPVAVSGGLTFSQLAAGDFHTCGRLASGSVYCWGANSTGQVGDGSNTDRNAPALVSGGLSFVQITAGAAHTCGLTSSGAAYCWGLNDHGQLGYGGTANSNTPVAVTGGLVFSQLAAGAYHTCGRLASGQVYCWGRNDLGQLGNGTTTDANVPVLVTGGLSFTALGAGRFHTCGLVSGTAYCWGNNFDGQIGDGTTALASAPKAVATAMTFSSLAAGGWHTCAVRATTGEAYCWGWNGVGQIGDGSAFDQTGPVMVAGGPWNFGAISAGQYHTCAANSPSTTLAAYCWGMNARGQLGDGTTTDRLAPTQVIGGLGFNLVVSGADHSCGLVSSGAAYCWGSNASGQLGNGTFTSSANPVAVSGGYTFVQLSAGDAHTCGRTTTNQLFCWGENGSGQLGNGSTSDSPVPVAPSLPGATFRWVSAGGRLSCAVTTTNSAYCWGDNRSGGLGTGTAGGVSTTPVAVSGPLSFNTVTAGDLYACGLTTTGDAYCWGENGAGQLGIGSTSNSLTPSRVSGGLTWKVLSAGRSASTCGISASDLLYCWGSNFFGQLGNGTLQDANLPKAVLAAVTFKDVQVGESHTCALTAAGVPYCWGSDERGELGRGSPTTVRRTPVAVLTGPAAAPPVSSSTYQLPVGNFREPATEARAHRLVLPRGQAQRLPR